jgi:hypothetical protein
MRSLEQMAADVKLENEREIQRILSGRYGLPSHEGIAPWDGLLNKAIQRLGNVSDAELISEMRKIWEAKSKPPVNEIIATRTFFDHAELVHFLDCWSATGNKTELETVIGTFYDVYRYCDLSIYDQSQFEISEMFTGGAWNPDETETLRMFAIYGSVTIDLHGTFREGVNQ